MIVKPRTKMQVILGRSTFPVDNVCSVEAYMTVYLNGNYEGFFGIRDTNKTIVNL